MNILHEIKNENDFKELMIHHHLGGYYYKHFDQELFKKDYLQTLHRNQLLQETLEEFLGKITNETKVVILKGQSLMGDIYHDRGERFMCDLDLMVSADQLEKTSCLFLEMGFDEACGGRWFANDFKKVMTMNREGMELVVELHTRLFYHTREIEYDLRSMDFHPDKAYVLGLEDQLIHLCGHVGFQHNFLKLYWLIDIVNFLKKYSAEIDWNRVMSRSKVMRVYRSVCICLWICVHFFELELSGNVKEMFSFGKKNLWKRLINYSFLIRPVEVKGKYLLMKHLNKDNFVENIIYNMGWIRSSLGF